MENERQAAKLAIPRLPGRGDSQRPPNGKPKETVERSGVRACSNFRKRKIRCDGEQPSCQGCLERETPCVYFQACRDRLKESDFLLLQRNHPANSDKNCGSESAVDRFLERSRCAIVRSGKGQHSRDSRLGMWSSMYTASQALMMQRLETKTEFQCQLQCNIHPKSQQEESQRPLLSLTRQILQPTLM